MQNKLHQGGCHMGRARKGPAPTVDSLAGGGVADGDGWTGVVRWWAGRPWRRDRGHLGGLHGRRWLAHCPITGAVQRCNCTGKTGTGSRVT